MSIRLFDTTLRDGTQREGVSLTTEDKIRIARELDALGLHYIEAGFPASNPKDLEFFENFDASELKNAKLVAFTRARRPNGRAEEDPAVTAIGDFVETDIVLTLDSGCVDLLVDMPDMPGYSCRLEESPGSKRGQKFIVGNGG